MQALDAPVYEVRQDSEWYISKTKRDLQIKEFFKKINAEYFRDNGFSFYHSEWFGVRGNSADYETYKNEVMKKPNKDGVHIFKKRSKYFPIFKELLEQIDGNDPFKEYDVLGQNNITASQRIGDRWFFEIKNENHVKGDEVEPIAYKDYLKVLMDSMREDELVSFKLPERFKKLQLEIYEKKYIRFGDKEVHVSELKNRSVTSEMKSQMRMNSYAQDDLPPKLTDEALIDTVKYYMSQCSKPNFPCATYDETLIHKLLPEVIKRLEEKLQ